MTTTTQVHVMDNEMELKSDRLWEGIEDVPGYGNDTVLIKVSVPAMGWQVTFFVNGDDAMLFKLQGQLHDLADQVEGLISDEANIVADQVLGQAMAAQDGEGM